MLTYQFITSYLSIRYLKVWWSIWFNLIFSTLGKEFPVSYYIKNQTLTLDEEIFPSMWHILLLVLLKDLVEMIWRNLKCQACLLHFLLHLGKENNLCFGIELWPYQWFPFLVHHLPKIRRSLWFFHKDWTKKNWTIFQTLN